VGAIAGSVVLVVMVVVVVVVVMMVVMMMMEVASVTVQLQIAPTDPRGGG
jgi:hypothetical protein